MSASPSGPSNSGTPVANGQKKKVFKKNQQGDPLGLNRRPNQRPLPPQKPSNPWPNSSKPNARPSAPLRAGEIGSAATNGLNPPKAQTEFSEIPTGPFQEFPLVTTKRALREGLRYHVARFSTRKDVDPTNQNDFTRPVSLHRRDPRQPPPGKAMKMEDPATGLPLDEKEQERLEKERLERDAQKAAELAQIAPTGNNASALAAKKNTPYRNEKTTKVNRIDKTEEESKESELKYEEALPWHLEDAENKHTWVGNYEAALSDTNVIFLIEDNCFKMIPLEKWYKFTPKNQFKTMTIEEAEAQMEKKSKTSRWVMHTKLQQQEEKEKQEMGRQMRGLYTVKKESSTAKMASRSEAQNADEVDFDDAELFDDDDEKPLLEEADDEDTKYAAAKIKREQMGANLFGQNDENEVDKEFEEEEKYAAQKKILGEKVKKALKKRERNYLYDSDSSHPYSTSSEDDTSDEERKKKKEEEDKKEEEAKLKAKLAAKPQSGAATKGTNTPSAQPKQIDNQKNAKSLKRPGSPNLSASETSGNESSRKKHKNKHVVSPSQPIRKSTPVPSRPMSPALSASAPAPGTQPRKTSVIKLNLNPSRLSDIQSAPPNPSAVMSDGEGTTGEMSDGAGGPKKKKKGIKLRLGSGASLSPSASRAGSPANLSRAGSPAAAAGRSQTPPPASTPPVATKTPASQSPKPVTAEEIVAILPAEGISIADILKKFSRRIEGKIARDRFIRMVKENGAYNSEDKLLRPKA